MKHPMNLLGRVRLYEFRSSRSEFYRDLAEMHRRGEAMLAFLEGELDSAAVAGQGSRAYALRLILARYRRGAMGGRLEYLLKGIVPDRDALMIAGVERARRKADALMAVKTAVEQQAAMKKIVLFASAMPMAIAPLCVFIIKVVSDVLQSIDKSAEASIRDPLWSGFNGLAKVIADLAVTAGPGALAVFLAAMAALVWSLPRWRGRMRLWADRMPVYSLYRDYQAGLLFSSMAMLLKNGGSLRGTIEDLAQRSNPVMRWHLVRVLKSLDDAPTRVIEAFSRGVLSPFMLARASTLHRSAASFADVLVELGTTEGGRVLARVRRAALLANAAVVSVFATLAVILALASITVSGRFAALMEPTSLMAARQVYELAHPRGPLSIP
jgi:hypothetical protein